MHQTSPRGSFVNYKGKGKSQREVVCRMAASFPCFCQFLRRGRLFLLLILLLVFWRNISWVNNKQPRRSSNGRYHQQRRRGIRFVCRRAKALVLLLLLRRVVIIRLPPHTIHPGLSFSLICLVASLHLAVVVDDVGGVGLKWRADRHLLSFVGPRLIPKS